MSANAPERADEDKAGSLAGKPRLTFLPGYRLPGYERAFRSVFGRAHTIVVTAHLPIPLQKEPSLEESWSNEQLVVGTPVSTSIPVHLELVVPFKASMDGDFELAIRQVADAAEEHARVMEKGYLRVISDTCNASGQVLKRDTTKPSWDYLLDVIEQTRIDFDPAGAADFSSFYWVRESGADIRYFKGTDVIAEFALTATEAQKKRLVDLLERKRRERATGERYF